MDPKKETQEDTALAKRVGSFGGVTIPEASAAFKKQKELIDLAEKLLKPEDYVYALSVVGSADAPKLYGDEETAKKVAKNIERDGRHQAKIVKVKVKSAWLRLGLHLGVTVPPGQENQPVQKETIVLSDNIIAIKTSGPGYSGITLIGIGKGPDGKPTGSVLHSETTAAVYWPGTNRTAVRSGACSSRERKFAHSVHDPIAMSETRAFSRAQACVLGFGDTTAEELEEGDVEPGKPTPKQSPKKAGDKKKGKQEGPKKEESQKLKEEPKGETSTEPENRKSILQAAIADIGGDGDKIVEFFKEWKEKWQKEHADFEMKTTMSKLDDEAWAAFRKSLNQWIDAQPK